jgi:large subunit ribosomal protein L23
MTKRTAYDVIIAPVITEKATLASEANQVIFKVNRQATKPEIKSAIESLFKGKLKAFRGRPALLSDTKRAVITLEDGHSIDVTTGL